MLSCANTRTGALSMAGEGERVSERRGLEREKGSE